MPDEVKKIYLGTPLNGTVVTRAVDGAPQRVVRTESGRPSRTGRAAHGRCRGPHGMLLAFPARPVSRCRGCLREGLAMKKSSELTWAQVAMAANAPMMTKAALVDGRTDVGVLPTGQVVGSDRRAPDGRRADRSDSHRGERGSRQALRIGDRNFGSLSQIRSVSRLLGSRRNVRGSRRSAMAECELVEHPKGIVRRAAFGYSRRKFKKVVDPGTGGCAIMRGFWSAMGALETVVGATWRKARRAPAMARDPSRSAERSDAPGARTSGSSKESSRVSTREGPGGLQLETSRGLRRA